MFYRKPTTEEEKQNELDDALFKKQKKLDKLEKDAVVKRMTSVEYLPIKEAIHKEYDDTIKTVERKFSAKTKDEKKKADSITNKLVNNPPIPPKAPDEVKISKEIFKNGMIDDLIKYEDNVEHLYLDSNGNPTIGIGNHVETKDEYAKLPLKKERKMSASKKEKEAEYDKMMEVKKSIEKSDDGFNKHHSKYTEHTNLELDAEDAKKIAQNHVLENVRSLLEKMPGYEDAPVQAKKALTEMEFNMGRAKFTNKNTVDIPWTKLFKAVKDGDWEVAAKECKRGGINNNRNNWAKQMFLNAATAAKAEKTKDKLSKIVSYAHKNKLKNKNILNNITNK